MPAWAAFAAAALAAQPTVPDTRWQAGTPLMLGITAGWDVTKTPAFVPAYVSPSRASLRARAVGHAGDWLGLANLDVQPIYTTQSEVGGTDAAFLHLDLNGGYAFPLGTWRLMPHLGAGVDLTGRDFGVGPTAGLAVSTAVGDLGQGYGLFNATWPVVATGGLDRLVTSIVGRPYGRLTLGFARPLGEGRALHVELGARMEPGVWAPAVPPLSPDAMPPKLMAKTMSLVPFLAIGLAFGPPYGPQSVETRTAASAGSRPVRNSDTP